jgi:hypothetical protein
MPIQCGVAEAGVHTIQVVQEPAEHIAKPRDNLWETVQPAATAEFGSIVHNRFEAEDALAFGVRLQSQLAKVQLENRQIIRRSVDHNLQSSSLVSPVAMRATFATEDGLPTLHIQTGTTAVHHCLEQQLHNGRPDEKSDSGCIQPDRLSTHTGTSCAADPADPAKTQTRTVNPAIADLAQSPCRPTFEQGICDFGQTGRAGKYSEAVSLLCELNAATTCLTGDVLVTVQNDLGTERRMSRHLDRDMAPVGIHDVERIMVDERLPGFKVLNNATC